MFGYICRDAVIRNRIYEKALKEINTLPMDANVRDAKYRAAVALNEGAAVGRPKL